MTHEEETMDARSAMSQMSAVVLRELSDLHMDKRDRDDLIASQQKQIKILRENSEYHEDRANHAYKVADISNMFAYVYLIVAFIAIGYGVWVG